MSGAEASIIANAVHKWVLAEQRDGKRPLIEARIDAGLVDKRAVAEVHGLRVVGPMLNSLAGQATGIGADEPAWLYVPCAIQITRFGVHLTLRIAPAGTS